MNSIILYALICTGFGSTESCQAYELDHNLSQEDCDSYFTDSGIDQVDNLLFWYVPEYKEGDNVVLSCGV